MDGRRCTSRCSVSARVHRAEVRRYLWRDGELGIGAGVTTFDVVVTPPAGRRHVLWERKGWPLSTVYMAVSADAVA